MDEKDCIVISEYHYGEVYESREKFDNSMFHRVYKRAYDIVQDSVYRQLDKKEKRIFQENVDNIVTFIGRRGTGKSSAMISFMQGLLENCNEYENNDFTIYNKSNECWERRKVQFIGIDCIDASLLEKGEDIFEEILAKMLKEFMKVDEESGSSSKHDYEKKDLYRKFDSIYKKVLNLKKREQVDTFTSEMALSNLRDLARSTDIRQEFQVLVEEYIRMKEDIHHAKKTETFLVVAIDDMDMNVGAGFKILEQIQRYLRVRHMIVLLAVNQEQMKLCCENHFAGMFERRIGYKLENRKQRISDLSDQYMEKGLPAYTRVYLPSLKKMDYDKNRATKIQIAGEEEQPESIKKAVLLTMWKKTRVRYDVEGKKRHFMEPQSLRELNNSGIFRKHMKNLVWDKEHREEFLEQLDFNYRRCMDDLLFRYANEILTGEESRFFLQLSETDIRRRGEDLVTRFCAMAEQTEKKVPENFDAEMYRREFLDGYRIFRYSYGEMLHAIFCVGRMNLYEKPLIHAILAMYSLTLTKIFYRYKDGSEENGVRKRNYEMLKEVVCNSVGGSWSRQLLPKVYKGEEATSDPNEEEKETYYAGTAQNTTVTLIQKVTFKNNDTNEKKDQDKDSREINWEEIDWEKIDWKEIEWKFILFLFLKTDHAQWKPKIERAKQNSEIVLPKNFETEEGYFEINGNKIDYNIMNFVDNIFMLDEKIVEFADNVCGKIIGKKLREHVEKVENGHNIGKSSKAGPSSFWKEMIEWHRQYGGMVVPAYSIDVYYNMFKRLTRDQGLKGKDTIKKSQLYDEFKQLLENIEKRLQANDEVYWGARNNMDRNDEIISFKEIFLSCPVIKQLKDVEKVQNRKEEYNDFIYSLISVDSNSTIPMEERREKTWAV